MTSWTFLSMMTIVGASPFIAPSGWGAGIGISATLLVGGLAIYGFYTSLGGQPLFGRGMVGD